MTRKYINTTFEDIYALYKFDRELRELTFKYLCEVEMKNSSGYFLLFLSASRG